MKIEKSTSRCPTKGQSCLEEEDGFLFRDDIQESVGIQCALCVPHEESDL